MGCCVRVMVSNHIWIGRVKSVGIAAVAISVGVGVAVAVSVVAMSC